MKSFSLQKGMEKQNANMLGKALHFLLVSSFLLFEIPRTYQKPTETHSYTTVNFEATLVVSNLDPVEAERAELLVNDAQWTSNKKHQQGPLYCWWKKSGQPVDR